MLSKRVLPFTLLSALLLLAAMPACHAGGDDNSLTPLSDLAKKVQSRGGGGGSDGGGGIVHSFLIPLAELVLDPHSAYYRRQKQTPSSSTKIGETKKGGSGLRPLPSASFCKEEGASVCEDIETLKKLSPNKVEVVVKPPTAAQEHDEAAAAEEEGQQHEDDDGERLHFVFTEVSVSKNSAGKKLRKGICRISLKSSSSSAKPHDAEEAKLLEEAAESEDEDEEEEELSFHYSSDSSSEDPVFDLLRSIKTASSDKTKKTSKKNKKADIVGSVRLVLPDELQDSTTQNLLRKFHFSCTSSRLCKQYLSGTWTLGMGNEYQLRYLLAIEQGEIGTSSMFSFFFQRWLKMPFGVSVVFGLLWAYNAVERWRAARRASSVSSSSAGGAASSSLKQE